MRHKPSERLDISLGHLNAGKLKPFEQLGTLHSAIFHAIDREYRADMLRILGAAMVLSVSQEPIRGYFASMTFALMTSGPSQSSSRFIERLLGLGNSDDRYLLLDLESLSY